MTIDRHAALLDAERLLLALLTDPDATGQVRAALESRCWALRVELGRLH